MNCYACDASGTTKAAVAICRHCGVAMCRAHLDEDLLLARPHGMIRHACTHNPVHNAVAALEAGHRARATLSEAEPVA